MVIPIRDGCIASLSISLSGIFRKVLIELSWHAVEFLRIDRRLALDRNVWPNGCILGIQLEPVLKVGPGVGNDGLRRTFGLAHIPCCKVRFPVARDRAIESWSKLRIGP